MKDKEVQQVETRIRPGTSQLDSYKVERSTKADTTKTSRKKNKMIRCDVFHRGKK